MTFETTSPRCAWGSAPPEKMSGTRTEASKCAFFQTWRCSMVISPWSDTKTTSVSSHRPAALVALITWPIR